MCLCRNERNEGLGFIPRGETSADNGGWELRKKQKSQEYKVSRFIKQVSPTGPERKVVPHQLGHLASSGSSPDPPSDLETALWHFSPALPLPDPSATL